MSEARELVDDVEDRLWRAYARILREAAEADVRARPNLRVVEEEEDGE